MNVLIVDDNLDKLSDVTKLLVENELTVTIDTVEDIQGAMLFLKERIVDLLIVDQYLPLRKGGDSKILKDGGSQLLMEINRKSNQINTPRYIVGLSQFTNENALFSSIWRLINYSPTHTTWHSPLNELLKHISKLPLSNNQSLSIGEMIPTIFVEGLTDEKLLNHVTKVKFGYLMDKFLIRSQKNAGANWVAQQLIIWAHKLTRDSEKNLLKAVGLLDYDGSGIKAKTDVKRKLNSQNQMDCTKLRLIQAKYSNNLIEFYKRGLQIELEIESLLPCAILEYADKKGWLEPRRTLFMELPKEWNQMSESLSEYLDRINFPKNLRIYLKKVKISKKEDFVDYVISQSQKQEEILENLTKMLQNVLESLDIKT